MRTNVITAAFGLNQIVTTDPAWYTDSGMVLQITGLDLPSSYQVHFSNTPEIGDALSVPASSNTVNIPDQYFLSGANIYAWIYYAPTSGTGYTVAMVIIPVQLRPGVTDEIPTPEQQSILDQAIAALEAAEESLRDAGVIVVNCGTISSLPKTVSNANITSDMVSVKETLGTLSAQTSDWTVTTTSGSLTITGSISGSTTLTLYMMHSA